MKSTPALPKSIDSLSLREARRVAIAAQQFGAAKSADPISRRHVQKLVETLGVLQIDSVNVLARAHTLPTFSRLGNYATDDLFALSYGGRKRAFFEYWAHEASLLPVALQPLLRWRMARAANGQGIYTGIARFGREQQPLIQQVLREIDTRGPLAAAEVSLGAKGQGGWWGWPDAKTAFEWLFWAGEITTSTRRGAFERVYDLTERALPQAIVDTKTPSEPDAIRALMHVAANAMGIGTERCLRDYYRIGPADARIAIADLVEAGDILPVTVQGWSEKAYLAKTARRPRTCMAHALLAPFDPLIWQRERAEGLFGARIRLEIYTPAEKRVHGYYVLPFLMNEQIVARVDLKADRQNQTLRVLASHLELGCDASFVASALAKEVALMAIWLGLPRVDIAMRGDLASELKAAMHYA